MSSSTGSELNSELQARVDRLWVACVNCDMAERQGTWDRGLAQLCALVGDEYHCGAMTDAVQDTGFRLGVFHYNALSARFYGVAFG